MFAYCLNNPLKYTDPSGWWTWKGLGGAFVTGALGALMYGAAGLGPLSWVAVIGTGLVTSAIYLINDIITSSPPPIPDGVIIIESIQCLGSPV